MRTPTQAIRRAVFLDRDGTLNVEKKYLFRVEDWEWIPGAVEAIRLLSELGYELVVVTNQAGVARGYYTATDVEQLHRFVADDLASHGLSIAAFHHCPHHPDFGDVRQCDCRKPGAGMLLAAATNLEIDLSRSWMIGDKLIDIEAGRKAGTRSILVRTGYGRGEEARAGDTIVVEDVLAAARYIRDQDA
jgi:D-glycero-D-manno-heptose 1,7-bisphosphate phosphatase